MPALRASVNASLTTASAPPITIWLQTLHSCPAPASPMRMTRSGLPIASRMRLHLVERARIPADHDRQRPADRANLAAADRRVEHRRAERGGALGQPLGHVGRDAARVNQNGAALYRAEHTVRPLEHLLDVRAVGHHRDDAGRLARDIRRRRRRSRAGGNQVVHRWTAPAVDDERVASLEEIFRHGTAHEAEPDESNSSLHAAQYSATRSLAAAQSGFSRSTRVGAQRFLAERATICAAGPTDPAPADAAARPSANLQARRP